MNNLTIRSGSIKKGLSNVMLATLVPCAAYAREIKDRWERQENRNTAVTVAAGSLAVSLILASICLVGLVSALNRPRSLRDRVRGWLTA